MAFNTAPNRRIMSAIGHERPVVKIGKVTEMDRQSNELIASTDDGHLRVFVRPGVNELTTEDLEIVAGGRKAMWIPWG
jgi:hypothetical protein